MNKLITDIWGGFPFFLNDFRFHEASVRSMFKGLCNLYSEDRYIISGCELTTVSSTLVNCSEGFLFWDNEILHCPGGTVTADETNIPVFELEVFEDTSDPAGVKTFSSGLTHNVYQVRRAKFTSVTLIGDRLQAYAAKRLPKLMAEAIADLETAWLNPSMQNGWTTSESGSLSLVAYKKDLFGNVWLRGQASGGSGVLFTLPASHRPQRSRYYASVYPSDASITKVTISMLSGFEGNVSILGPGDKVNLDGIVFRTD